ncbi:hypothetical protein B0J17DRAFT_714861 [Rhizoctonia solani]|nr:hypothetical protein B0J17DRAFT_714861 [Rhizoctonia solani]
MFSEEDYSREHDNSDLDIPRARGKPQQGADTKPMIYSVDTRVLVQRDNGDQFMATVKSINPNGRYTVRDDSGEYRIVRDSQILEVF